MAKNNRISRTNRIKTGIKRSEPRDSIERVQPPDSVQRFQQRDIIVIGGSAGCIGPLKTLVSRLPAGLPAAIFVTVHVSSEAPSVLPVILMRAGHIPAVHPLSRQPIMKSTIYVAPPDQHMLIEDGCVLTSRGPRENLHRPAIDPLFRSAARSYGSRVIGIVMSGLLNDGSSGLMAVKLRGGLAVVQDPAEAAFPEMPERAWHYAGVEYVLPISGIERLVINSVNGHAAKSHLSQDTKRLATVPLTKILSTETQNAQLENQPVKEKLGMPSAYACPECHGVLWEVKEEKLRRFRCRVGHSYTAETLNLALSKSMEDALWVSMRALEEKVDLLRRMAARSEAKSAARFEEEAENYEKHATAIRDILTLESGAASATASG